MIVTISAIVAILTMAFVSSFITLKETHRAIGPAGRMENIIREMINGDFSCRLM